MRDYAFYIDRRGPYETLVEVHEISQVEGFDPNDPTDDAIEYGASYNRDGSLRINITCPAGVGKDYLIERVAPWCPPKGVRTPAVETVTYEPGSTHHVLGKPKELCILLGGSEGVRGHGEIALTDTQIEFALPPSAWKAKVDQAALLKYAHSALVSMRQRLKASGCKVDPLNAKFMPGDTIVVDGRAVPVAFHVRGDAKEGASFRDGRVNLYLPNRLVAEVLSSQEFDKQVRAAVRSVSIDALRGLLYDQGVVEVAEKVLGVKASGMFSENPNNRLGCCAPRLREIWLVDYLGRQTPTAIAEVTVHELCHLIESEGHGHGPRFYKVFREAWPKIATELRMRGVDIDVSWERACMLL